MADSEELKVDATAIEVDEQQLALAYHDRNWSLLNEIFLRGWCYLHTAEALQNQTKPSTLLNFVRQFLHYWTQRDFQVDEDKGERFIMLGTTIANVVAATPFRTTDAWLSILADQPHNLARLLTLYSARNELSVDAAALFAAHPYATSMWWCHSFMMFQAGSVHGGTHERLKQHMKLVDRVSSFANLHQVAFACTYIDPDNDRPVKEAVNAYLQQQYAEHPLDIKNTPNPKSIGVISGCWRKGHSVWRNQFHMLQGLRDAGYRLTLVYCNNEGDPEESLFAEVRRVAIKDAHHIDLSAIMEQDFGLAYFPDVGMHQETVMLSNLEIAPIMVTSYGHSCSTYGSAIDYWIGSEEVEVCPYPEGWRDGYNGLSEAGWACLHPDYSERFIPIPGMGITNTRPDYEPQGLYKPAEDDEPVLVNCSWFGQKIHDGLIATLDRIRNACTRPVRFRLFSGGASVYSYGWPAFVAEVKRVLGDAVEVMPAFPYQDYMAEMEKGAFTLDPFPFGGCNTVADALWLRQPVVCLEGDKWRNRIGPALLSRTGGAGGWGVCQSVEQYISVAATYINHPMVLAQQRQYLEAVDMEQALMGENEATARYFTQAITALIAEEGIAVQEAKTSEVVA